MSDLNMQIVREFFELRLFRVLTHWQHEALFPRGSDSSVLLFVELARTAPGKQLPFLLHPEDCDNIQRAVVEVRAWHTDRVYPSLVESNPILGHVASEEVKQLTATVFGTREFHTILVISELSASPGPRDRALSLLQGLGIDHVVEFSAVLHDMAARVSENGNYAPSQTLQMVRLLKRYGLIKNQQLEFAFNQEAPPARIAPPIHALPESDE